MKGRQQGKIECPPDEMMGPVWTQHFNLIRLARFRIGRVRDQAVGGLNPENSPEAAKSSAIGQGEE